jgi:FdhD protein
LRNQRLVASPQEVESITVDWEVGAAAVKTRSGIDRIEERTARRVVTTGCGQGSVFGALMDDVQSIALPQARLTQAQLYALVNAIRSVHACALFHGSQMQVFVEDVGRHNAIDTIAGWMWMHGVDTTVTTPDTPYVFYTTGRLTSEMIIKSAQMGVALVVSRSGMTQMGHQIAQQLDLCAIGRATNKHFLCYSAPERLLLQPELAASRLTP